MDNQHKKIKGYPDLSQSEIDAINQIKEKAAEVGELFKDLENRPELDKRWLAIAKTDLQKGFMAATRSVAKPDFF
jgi:anion-transporting  ArsA/GET3 family ATPase